MNLQLAAGIEQANNNVSSLMVRSAEAGTVGEGAPLTVDPRRQNRARAVPTNQNPQTSLPILGAAAHLDP
jgi:hypothetical protein